MLLLLGSRVRDFSTSYDTLICARTGKTRLTVTNRTSVLPITPLGIILPLVIWGNSESASKNTIDFRLLQLPGGLLEEYRLDMIDE